MWKGKVAIVSWPRFGHLMMIRNWVWNKFIRDLVTAWRQPDCWQQNDKRQSRTPETWDLKSLPVYHQYTGPISISHEDGKDFLKSFMTNQKRFTTSKLIVLLISSVWLEIKLPVQFKMAAIMQVENPGNPRMETRLGFGIGIGLDLWRYVTLVRTARGNSRRACVRYK